MPFVPYLCKKLVTRRKTGDSLAFGTLMRKRKLNLAVIGMGNGGLALVKIFSEDPDTVVVGVCHNGQNIPGILWAKEKGIYTTSDFKELLEKPEIDIVVNATGNSEVEEYIESINRPEIEVVKGLSAGLMWRILDEREGKEREAQRRLAEQQYLYDIGLTLSSAENSEKALKLIVTAAMDLLDMSAGSAALFEEKNGEMRMAVALGFKTGAPKNLTWKVVPGGFTNYILSSKRPVAIEDVSIRQEFETSRLEKEGFKSLIAIPLRAQRKIVGILYVDDYKPRKFSDRNISLMGLLGTMAASAIEKILMLEQAEKMAVTDGLTKLFNHRYFKIALISELKRVKRYNENLSVFMIDVDHFKNFNDTQGHLAGNRVLIQLAKILTSKGRETDIVARYGGEEFSVILPKTSRKQAKEVAERLCNEVGKTPFPGEEKQPGGKLTISIGLASFPEDTSDADDYTRFLEMADRALYRAKETGRNRVSSYGE